MTKGGIKLNVGSIYAGVSHVTKETNKYGPDDYRFYGLVKPTSDIEVKEFIEQYLFIYKEGRKVKIKVSRKMVEFICDYFFERERYGILWKNRGGSGTLSASIIIFLKTLFQAAEITNMAGSSDQAKNCFKYVIGFYNKCIPGLSEMIQGRATKTEMFLKNGAKIKVIPASETAARGIHYRILLLDEACQKNPGIAPIMKSAINTVFSEPNNMIILLSTFHAEEVLFSHYWDHAEETGFKKYYWTIYDSMQLCTKSASCCAECPLTTKEEVLDRRGNITGHKYDGCNGAAHTSNGYMTFDQVLDTKVKHAGREEEYMIEHESKHPRTGGGLVYSAYDTYNCECMDYYVDTEDDMYSIIVGIDWGFSSSSMTAITVAEFPCYLDEEEDTIGWPRIGFDYLFYANNKGMDHILSVMMDIEQKYEVSKEKIFVRADASHPFNNQELRNAGYNVKAIHFKKYKEMGIKNVSMFLRHGMILFYSNKKKKAGVWEMPYWMGRYRILPNDKYNKEDHIPDAILCALSRFNFLIVYEDYLKMYRAELVEEFTNV